MFCRLALYVYEYLLHVGAQKSAQTFLSEVRRRFPLTLLLYDLEWNMHFPAVSKIWSPAPENINKLASQYVLNGRHVLLPVC